jgi:hypothetical protein
MNKKIIGILVVTLFITATVLPVAGNVSIKNNPERFDKDSIYDESPIEFFEKFGELNDRVTHDMIIDIKQTSDGGYIATGVTQTYAANFYDVWLVKLNSSGDQDWYNTFDQVVGNDFGFSVQQTSDGGYIVAGCYAQTGSALSVYLIKTDSNGDLDWEKKFGTASGHDIAYCVTQTSDGGYAVIALTQSYGAGSNDAWLIKTDSDGEEEWSQTYGGVSSDNGFCVKEIDDGFIITGETETYGNGDDDLWLIKTDSNGDELWNVTHGGEEKDSGHCIVKTSSGYNILGSISSEGDPDDFWLIETDSSGSKISDKTWTGADSGVSGFNTFSKFRGGISMKNTNDDGLILTGITDADGGGTRGAYLIKLDSSGNEDWKQLFGGTAVDEIYSVDKTSDGGYILGGCSFSYGTTANDGWFIKTDSEGSEEWNVTIPINEAPYVPRDPDPEDEETNVEIDISLSWTCGDPNEDTLLYDVYFGTDSSPPKVESNHSATTYDPGILDFETEYFWQIIARDPRGLTTSGPIWSFTTEENLPPNVPSNPDPADGATDVSIEKILSWDGGDPNSGDVVTYDVYFGIDSSPPLVDEDIEETEYDPGTMELATTYYWQIVSEDSQGLTADGDIWSFTTEEEPNEPPTAPEIDGPTEGPVETLLCWTFHSEDPNGNDVRYHIEWGDNSNLTITDFYPSCTPIEMDHTYAEKGTYTISVYAEDTKEAESDESTLEVIIPRHRSRITFHPLIIQLFERFPIFQQLFRIYQ